MIPLNDIVIFHEPILSTRNMVGLECGICYVEFKQGERAWTHEDPEGNGQRHDPFHEHCLIDWLERIPRCPMDQTPIDLNSMLRKTNTIFKKTKQCLLNTACSASLGALAAGVIGVASAVGAEDRMR